MYKRTLFALAIAASVAIAQPPAPRPICMAAPAHCPTPVHQQLVRAEMTIVRLHPETIKSLELWDDCDQSGQKCFLTPCQVRKVMERAKEDNRCEVLSSPQIVALDGQRAFVQINSSDSSGLELSLLPRASLDHKFIQMALSAEHKEVEKYCAECGTFSSTPEDENDTRIHRTVHIHQMHTIVTVPTGNSVMMELCRNQPIIHCANAGDRVTRTKLAGTGNDHICVIVTPSEVNSACCAQPMPVMQAECVGPCQVFMPAPPMMAVPPMMACDVAMPGCCQPNRTFAFVPAQEQMERAVARTTNRTLEKLLEKYDDACANGDTEKARKLARRCVDIDPTCFMRDR